MPTLQARSFGAGGVTSLPPQARGPWVPAPLPRFGSSPGRGGPHCGHKDGNRMGEEEEQKALILLLPWGQGLIPLEGQRQEVETPGAGFFKTGLILIFIIFSVFP